MAEPKGTTKSNEVANSNEELDSLKMQIEGLKALMLSGNTNLPQPTQAKKSDMDRKWVGYRMVGKQDPNYLDKTVEFSAIKGCKELTLYLDDKTMVCFRNHTFRTNDSEIVQRLRDRYAKPAYGDATSGVTNQIVYEGTLPEHEQEALKESLKERTQDKYAAEPGYADNMGKAEWSKTVLENKKLLNMIVED